MTCHSCGTATNPGDKFCANCGASLEQRCATCGTHLPDDARFCPSCGSSVGEVVGAVSEASDEERKVVSVLFADLVGFTASSDGADPEDVRRRVQPFHTALREVVEGFGGRIEKLMGDGVLAVFGAPVVHEDDAERAVRAGLQIQDRIESMAGESTGLQARVAVGTGEAMVLVEGTTTDREGLIGDVVNTASRLQGEAEPGTVLVDDTTYRATRRAFHYEERAPVAVKGKSEPIAVWVPRSPVARLGTDLEDDGATLVGRSSELALLIDAFTRAVDDGTSQIVTIGGEPGVGKSRMVRELRRHINDLPDLVRWRQGRCLPYGEGITYWALGEVVKAEAGILETDTPATALGKLGASLEPLLDEPEERSWIAGRLAPLVGSDHEASADKAERFAAWYRYLSAFGEQRPSVIVIEDLHWADANLVELLADVPDATRGTPLLLVCTARPDFFEAHATWGGGQRNAVTIRLEPLDADATSELLDELLSGEGLAAETRQMILDRSGGNPLWAQEFVRMLHDRAGDESEMAIPDTVQAVVAARIDLLEPDTKTVVQAASTIGKSFWIGAIREMLSDVDRIEESLRELERRELIRRERVSTVGGETEYAFTHSVVRDVAYSQSPRAVRAQRHRKTARWIERMAGDRVADRAEVIAHHDAEALRLATATGLEDVTEFVDAAIASHERAAEQAAQLDLVAGIAHLEAALELAPTGDDRRGRLLFELGRTYVFSSMSDAASKTLLEAREELDRAGDVERWGMATSHLDTNAWLSGDAPLADQYCAEAIDRLEQYPAGPALAKAYSHRAGRLWLRGDSIEETLELIAEVGPIVEVHGDLESRRRILSAEGGSRFDAGDPAAVEHFRRVLRMAIEADDSTGIGSGYLNLGEQLRTGWGMHEAIAVHERGLEVALQRRARGVEQFVRYALADDYLNAARWDEALEEIETFLGLADRLVYLEHGFVLYKQLINACRGVSGDEVREDTNRLIALSEELEDLQARVPAYLCGSYVMLMLGDEDTATSLARKVVEEAGGTRFLVDGWPMTLWLLRRAGELDRLEALLPQLRRFDMPRPRAQIQWLEALLSEGEDPQASLDSLAAAAADLAELDVVVEAVVALSDAVRIASDLGDTDRADALRSRAQSLMDGTGADPFLEVLGLA